MVATLSKKRSREAAGIGHDEEEALLVANGVPPESSLFQLQTAELLSERRVDYERTDAVDDILRRLSKVLRAMPEHRVEHPPEEAAAYLQRLGLPQRPLRFHPPERVYPVGGWAARTLAQPRATVDVAVQVPAACFDEKDQLNGRYAARRAQYLCEVAAALRRKAAFKRLSWEFLQHDARKPVLLVEPQLKGLEAPAGVRLRLIPTLAAGTFPTQKLTPERNNLRASKQAAGTQAEEEAQLPATPLYNNAILQDLYVDAQQDSLQKAVEALPLLPDAIVLLKVWARTQALDGEPDGLSGCLLSMLAAHLTERGTLTAAMSVLQLVRAVLAALAKPATFAKGLVMSRQPVSGDAAARTQPPAAAVFRQHHSVVFLDPSGYVNLAAHVLPSALAQAQAAAKRALALLDAPHSPEGAFAALFLNRQSRGASFDAFWRVSLPLPAEALGEGTDQLGYRRLEARVESVAWEALGTRAGLVRAFRSRLGPSRLLTDGLPGGKRLEVLVAAQMDPATALRAVDMGPAADSPQAAAFRAFWGERAELRRFQAGNIAEAVVWESGASKRHLIADRALAYALTRHLGQDTTVSGCAGLLDAAMTRRHASPDDLAAARRDLEAALAKLGKQLRAVGTLPLKVVALQPLSAPARHTAAFPPLPHLLLLGPAARDGGAGADAERVPRCLEAVHLMVQLEGSGRWPDDPRAYAKAKAAMGCQLAEELTSGFGLRALASEHCVDVLTDGFAFRLFLASDRDQAMADRLQSSQEAGPGPASELAAAASHALLQARARHHGMMAALAGAAPAFPAAAQLAGRWLGAQMLSNQLRQEALELLVAAAFLPERGLPIPGSRLAGFLRFLHVLAEHPWRERPLVIDPENSMASETRTSAEAAYSKARREGSAPAMALVTPYDPASAAWTRQRPGSAVAHRLAALARRSLAVIQEHVEAGLHEPGAVRAACLGPALADFDALLLLRRDALPAADLALHAPRAWRAMAAGAGFRPLHLQGSDALDGKRARAVLRAVPPEVLAKRGAQSVARDLLVGFDPVAVLLRALEDRFGEAATFCADALGGSIVGVKWHPQVWKAHVVAASIAHMVAPVSTGEEDLPAKRGKGAGGKKQLLNGVSGGVHSVVLDADAVLAEMHVLGAGLVEGCLVRHHS